MEMSQDAERRRAIQLVLERRPEVDLDALTEILQELAFSVDEPTLAADLEALGYEIDDGSETHGAPAPVAAPPRPAPELDAFADVGPTPEPVPVDGTAGTAGPTIPRSASVVGAVMVLVGALLLAAILAAGNGDDGEDAATETSTTTASTAAADSAPVTTQGPVEPSPLGPGADPALGDGVDGASDFEGTALDGLGETGPGGLPWDIVAGQWSVADGQAQLGPVPEGEAAFALVDPALTDYRVQVRLPALAPNVGVGFWADSEGDGWMFVASPAYSTFVLVRVEGGEYEVIGNTGLTTTEGRAATIGIHVTGRRVEGLVDGAVLIEHELTEDPPGPGFGLGGLPEAGRGSFDDLVYKADG